jgi:hypothetical protein
MNDLGQVNIADNSGIKLYGWNSGKSVVFSFYKTA